MRCFLLIFHRLNDALTRPELSDYVLDFVTFDTINHPFNDMANWAFEIDVADNFIVGLTETLIDKGFRIWYFQHYEQPFYLFSSAYLAGVPEEQVYAQACQLARFIDGISYLLFENKDKVNKITLTRVIDADTFIVKNVPRTPILPVNIDFSGYKPGVIEDEDPVAHLLKLVPVDVFIRKLLLILSQGMDLKSVRQAYELVTALLIEKGSLLDFERVGPDASMSLKEAQDLVSNLIFGVLERYYRIYLRHCVVKDREGGASDWYDSLYD